ncbi:MAG: hypothetical protein VYE49_05550, partial [Pseudomonadota bacterium]|nr:hypothetical protein [Pseudomonadota bacterium]
IQWLAPVTALLGQRGIVIMGDIKERPANVPAENEYHNVHWLVLVTYAAAIAGLAILIVNAS